MLPKTKMDDNAVIHNKSVGGKYKTRAYKDIYLAQSMLFNVQARHDLLYRRAGSR